MTTKKKHCVYKYVLNGEIIYIGLADIDLDKRLSCHGKPGDNIDQQYWDEINKAEVYYIVLANSVMADVVEKELIRRYQPKCNKEYKEKTWSGLPFVEPEWLLYVKPEKPEPRRLDERLLRQFKKAEDNNWHNLQALDKILYYQKKLKLHPWSESHSIFICQNPENKPLDTERCMSAMPTVHWDTEDSFGTMCCPGHIYTHDGKSEIVFNSVQDALTQFEEMIEKIKQHNLYTEKLDIKLFGESSKINSRLPLRYKGILW